MHSPQLFRLKQTQLVLGVLSLATCIAANLSPIAFAQNGYLPPLQGRVVTAPAGTYMTATVNTPLSSEFARVGDHFNAVLGSDVAAGGSVILPAGSKLDGQVVSVKRAGRSGRNGLLDVRFTGATLPNGQRIPLSAKIQTQDGTGLIKGGTAKGRVGRAALKTGVGAGLGAALGTAMGPLSGGDVGRGAIYGTALGGGLGLASAAWKKGKEAVLPAGQPVNITLNQPLTTNQPANSYGSNNSYGDANNYNSNNGGYGQQQQSYGTSGTNGSTPYYNGQSQTQGYGQQPSSGQSYGQPYGSQQPTYGSQSQF